MNYRYNHTLLSNAAILLIISLGTLMFAGCIKDKKTFSGQLLLSKKYPRPLANKKLKIYQSANIQEGIVIFNFGTPESSTATGITDANGYFSLNFYNGKNNDNEALKFSNVNNDTSFPGFSRYNFPGPGGYDASKPIYVGKSIDTLRVGIRATNDITPTDTLYVIVGTTSGTIRKQYTGLSISSGTSQLLDIFYDALSTSFDCKERTFGIPVHAGIGKTPPWSSMPSISYKYPFPVTLSAEDEVRVEVYFIF